MNKAHKYTILTVFLALAFTFGSMAGMNFILREREKQFLTESGRVVVEAPIRAWQEQESGEKDENFDKEGYALTTGQMEEVINYWNMRKGITVHNPVNGQISMEKAIQAGEEWLAEMGMGKNNQIKDIEAYSINATLGVAMQTISTGVQLEPYYSFWTVRFTGLSMNTVLYINAVTGKVLGAEVCLYRNLPDKFPSEKLSLFVEGAGLQENDTEIVFNSDGTSAFLEIADSQLYAEMGFQRKQKGYTDLTHYEQGNLNADLDIYYKEYVVITYKLNVGESKIS